MLYEELIAEIESADGVSLDAREKACDALTFVASLHQLFKDTGMTTSEEPDVGELENLVDALYGELGAAVLFLCDPSFARAPDMLRAIGNNMEKMVEAKVVPAEIVKGFSRVAKRIENTRINQQQMARLATTAGDKT